MKATDITTEAVKQRLDPKCWSGKHKEGTKIKGGVRVNNCVPNESVAEGLPQTLRKVVPGHAKREIDKKMDAGKFGKTDADKDANFQRYKKIQDKITGQGVAETTRGSMGLHASLEQHADDKMKELGHKFVKDRKTGKMYNPDEQFDKTMNSPEVKAQMKRMAAKEGVAEGSNQAIDYDKILRSLGYVDSGLSGYRHDYSIRSYRPSNKALATGSLPKGHVEVHNRGGRYTFDTPFGEFTSIDDAVSAIKSSLSNQGVAEGNFNPDDDEAGMADNNLETLRRAVDGLDELISAGDNLPEWCQEKIAVANSMLVTVWNYMQSDEPEEDPEIAEMYEAMENLAEEMAAKNRVSVERVWESFESLDDNMLYETAAWHRKAGKNKNGGLNAKGVASYRREHPGSKLQTAVTTKPSKLKPGSKSAKRRKSFCARMSGVKGPMKKPNGKPTRKALALRKWNC